ncbi:(Fe-S)-binding protein [Gordoniibacillus kamchatkensis]|uniref:(Fe-S)-binding protein n=1 Tax=Gordoniibacillus kamchatkensis TaxID=1590651 RepID=UPI00069919AD|nr:(Fe-S)-binding protein [Paenibacillus sp. VKM B-2647]
MDKTGPQQKLFDSAHDEANRCVQCGYCLPACPTYISMGKESASPRGRINLVKLAAEGKIDIADDLAQPIDLCLGCRACEVACPVGVPYGHILESAKEAIADRQAQRQPSAAGRAAAPAGQQSAAARTPSSRKERWPDRLKRLAMTQLFPYPGRLRAAGNMLWLYQKSGLGRLLRRTKLLSGLSEPMAAFEQVLPAVEPPHKRYAWGSVFPAKGEKKARVAFFAGCMMDAMMSRTNRLTIELLTLVGCEVVVPGRQTCCGALHAHQGLKAQAQELAKANIAAFEQSGADLYINNAGGCGAMLHEYGDLLAADEAWAERARHFSEKSKDVTEILHQYGPLPFTRERHGVITYQDSCHLRNVQGVRTPPRELLKSIPGATFVEMEGCDQCCASGGIYNLLHFRESMNILDAKMNKANVTKADTIVTTNPGCLLQMRLGVERKAENREMEALHIVDVLAEACGLK